MEDTKARIKRLRKRAKSRRRPPPIFSNNSSKLNSFNASLMDNRAISVPSFAMNTNEIMDRFNELLDWRLPDLPPSSNLNDDIPTRYFDECSCSPSRDAYRDRHHSPPLNKRRKIESFDLRHRLLQQNKRWKADGNYGDNDRRDEFRGLNDTSVRNSDRWSSSFENIRRLADEPINRGFDMRDHLTGQREFWSNSNQLDRGVDFSQNNFDRDCRSEEFINHGFHQRHVKEYWSDRRASPSRNEVYEERRFLLQDDFVDKNRYSDRDAERHVYRNRERNYGSDCEKYPEKIIVHCTDPWHRDSVKYPGNLGAHDLNNDSRNITNEHRFPGLSSYDRSRSAVRGGNLLSSDETQSKNPPDEDLMILIHKPEFFRISFTEADMLRSMLIDLVVDCRDTNRMPEFVSSGLMKSCRAFYVNCRTVETLEWLLKQRLPPLKGIPLLMRKKNIYQVQVSSFASRCIRTKEEIIKLIKLQNGKKGFNFDDWTMKSYNSNPNGIYFAFVIPLEDAKLLEKVGCRLSFQLKTLIFKIHWNQMVPVSEIPPFLYEK